MGFMYKELADGTFCLTSYSGHEKEIVFPKNITVSILGDKLFQNHTEIEKLIIPSTVTQIGGWVFDGCSSLKTLQLPDGLIDMWQYALTRMSIEKIIIPNSLMKVIPFTFNECLDLKEVIIQEGTNEICGYAFKNCKNLESVTVPKSMKTIHEHAFDGCPKVKIHQK